jgi:hypothetical protein
MFFNQEVNLFNTESNLKCQFVWFRKLFEIFCKFTERFFIKIMFALFRLMHEAKVLAQDCLPSIFALVSLLDNQVRIFRFIFRGTFYFLFRHPNFRNILKYSITIFLTNNFQRIIIFDMLHF